METSYIVCRTSLVVQMVKNLLAVQETWVPSLVQKNPWRRECQPTPVFLPGEFHGQRSLVGYSPRSLQESDMSEQLSLLLYSVALVGELVLT